MIDSNDVTVILLAGGKGSRMGGIDKGLYQWRGTKLVEHVLNRITPQCRNILISANRNISQYQQYGFEVISDEIHSNRGPLSGVVNAGLKVKTKFILTIPCDTPLLPIDLVARFTQVAQKSNADVFYAHDGNRTQPLIMMFNRNLLDDMRVFLDKGQSKVMSWLDQHHAVAVDFFNETDAFTNVNTVEP